VSTRKPWLADYMERMDREEEARSARFMLNMQGAALAAAHDNATLKPRLHPLPPDHLLLGPVPAYLEPMTRKGRAKIANRQRVKDWQAKKRLPPLPPDHFLMGPIPVYLEPMTRKGKERERARRGMAAVRERRREGKPPAKRGRKPIKDKVYFPKREPMQRGRKPLNLTPEERRVYNQKKAAKWRAKQRTQQLKDSI
jgi:hypothetical protein